MLRVLGLPDEWVSYAWIAGPMSGTLVQPVIGVVSDACTSRWGRRRPFIVLGAASTAIALLLFAYARQVGAALFGGDPHQRGGGPLWVALFAFWLLDFSINAQTGPLRALLVDVTPRHQLADANAIFMGLGMGVGKTLGYGLGFLTGTLDPEHGVKILYTTAAAIVLVTASVPVCYVHEEPHRRRGRGARAELLGELGPPSGASTAQRCTACCGAAGAAIAKAFRGLAIVPPLVRKTFFVQFWALVAWFTVFMYITEWVGHDVNGGDANAAKGTRRRDAFDRGVASAQGGLCGMAALSTLLAFALPWAMARFGVRRVWGASLALMACALGATPLVGSIAAACFLIVTLAVSLAATYVIPWVIATAAAQGRVGTGAAGNDAGLITATFNLSQCLPEFVMALAGGPIVKAIGHGKISSVLVTGAVGALAAALGIWRLIPDELPEEEVADDGEEGLLLSDEL